MITTWRLDTPAQTMVFASFSGAMAACVYWGAPLPQGEDLEALAGAQMPAPHGGMLDEVAPVSVCPGLADGFAGQPGCALRGPDGAIWPRFSLAEDQSSAGHVRLRFASGQVAYWFDAEADAGTDVIALKAQVSGEGVSVDWLAAPVLPGPTPADDFLTFTGRWCSEFQVNRVPWTQGAYTTDAPGGRTSHERFPGVILPARGATETQGEAFGLHFGWSGGHRVFVEELPSGFRQVQFGAVGGASAPCETATLYATRSGAGINGVSQAFHRQARKLVKFTDKDRPRPVHYNCWEAVYFDHDPAVLRDLARRAADLGAERFVLDDGWFGRRDDDTSSLGDWWIDPRKWPEGLSGFIDDVERLGMTFGIWFEPEMINADSDLYRAHPDWVLGPEDQPTGRNQLVLDLSRDEVCDHLFGAIDKILSVHRIDYIKWDHNRALPHPSQAQTHALYGLLDRLQAAHPGVEIESCSSGGGRIDFGILARTQRVWTSDSNDAQERVKIQRGASYFLPPEITGSHIGPRICHTSGRQFPMPFRASVAGSRAMGLEMDLRELTEEEAAEIKASIRAFKARRGLLHSGNLHRLESGDPSVLAEMHVAQDGGEFALFAAQMVPPRQQLSLPLRLTGLDPTALYDVRLERPELVLDKINRVAKSPLVAGEVVRLSGAALMGLGLRLPNSFPDTMWAVNGTRV